MGKRKQSAIHEEPVKKVKRQSRDQKKLEYMCQHLPLMELMRDLSPQQCESLMPFIKTSAHDALCNCVYNALFNYKELTEEDKAKCKESMWSKLDNYRFLGDKSQTLSKKVLKKRGEYLEQSGSGFPAILAAVLPLFASLIAGK
jgi:hypothetical protein